VIAENIYEQLDDEGFAYTLFDSSGLILKRKQSKQTNKQTNQMLNT
jgi:transcriptional regulator of acetoin/glycerol metabolism